MQIWRVDGLTFVKQYEKKVGRSASREPIQEIHGENIHPWLGGAVFRLWQIPGEDWVWLSQHPNYSRPDNSEVKFLTGLAAESALEMGAFLTLHAERLSKGEAGLYIKDHCQ